MEFDETRLYKITYLKKKKKKNMNKREDCSLVFPFASVLFIVI